MDLQLVVLPTFQSTTVSSLATKITPARMCGIKICLAARDNFGQSLSRDCNSPSVGAGIFRVMRDVCTLVPKREDTGKWCSFRQGANIATYHQNEYFPVALRGRLKTLTAKLAAIPFGAFHFCLLSGTLMVLNSFRYTESRYVQCSLFSADGLLLCLASFRRLDNGL